MPEYKYETHCHTARCSACSKLSAGDIVSFYHKRGYQGVFVTDHFLNGNTTVPRDLPWQERIRLFMRGYEEVKEEGEKVGLDVFFGFESSYLGTDFLVYGLGEEWLARNEACFSLPTARLLDYLRAEGGFVIQAHPFREDWYIDHVRLYRPNVDGIEAYNSARDERTNRLAAFYADAYGMIKTGGSDIHFLSQPRISGMAFPQKLTCIEDYARLLRAGEGRILDE